MPDRPEKESSETRAPSWPAFGDLSGQILSGGPSLSARYLNRNAAADPEQSSSQPRSNRDKFPDTSGVWWPTDKSGGGSASHPFSKEDSPGGWGVHWFEPSGRSPFPPPGNGGGPKPPEQPPEKPSDTVVLKPVPVQPPRLTDDEARRSANENADARSIYLTAGLSSGGIGLGVHLADLKTGAVEPAERTGAVAFWRDNLSPSQRLVPERRAALQLLDDKLPSLHTELGAASKTFERQTRFRSQLLSDLSAEIPGGSLPESELKWYRARVELVGEDRLFKPENIVANSGTAEQVRLRERLFTESESSRLLEQSKDFWQAESRQKFAQTAVDETEAARKTAVQLLTQAERGSISTGAVSFLRGAGSGMLVAGATVVADNLLDSAMGNSPELSNKAHWGIQGIGMPLLLLSNASTPAKIAGSLAMVGFSHLMDKQMGPPTGIFSPFARPSLPEIALASAGASIPLRDMRLRAGLAVGGWMLGKTWNYLDARFEFTGKTEARLRDETVAALDMDAKSPSKERFNYAVSEMRQLSDKNDAAAAVLIKDWQSSGDSSINGQRGTAALLLGYGESLLARGTRTDRDKWDRQGDRILAGADYDLGGQATTYLRAASGNLDGALRTARENRGKTLGSSVIDDSYINQLSELSAEANRSLERVYGKHDIAAVFNELKKRVASNEEDMKSFAENLSQYTKVVGDGEPRFKAKLSRDLCLLHLAFAGLHPENGSKSEHYRNALRYLQEASRLDGQASDLPAVDALLKS